MHPQTLSMPATAAPIPTSEDHIQAAVIRWARAHDDPRLRLLFHIPNGGARAGATGGRMVALGAKAGVSDLFLPVPVLTNTVGMARLVPGLWIEMKTVVGTLSTPQQRWLTAMAAQGYATAVCRSVEAAQAALTRYLTHGAP
jgi:hypothetical protein